MKSVILASLAVAATALPQYEIPVIHEQRNGKAIGWSQAAIDPALVLPVRIGLTQQSLSRGHDLLMDVSSEHSPNYGKYFTQDQIIDLFAPSKTTVDRVTEWVTKSGVNSTNVSLSANKQWIQFDARASEVEDLLQTTFYMYTHDASSVKIVACDKYLVPTDVSIHVDYITPGTLLLEPNMKQKQNKKNLPRSTPVSDAVSKSPSTGSVPASCQKSVTPECIKAFYGITNGTLAAKGNEMGFFEVFDVYSNEDLDKFYSTYAKYIPKGTYPVVKSVDGATAPTSQDDAGAESMLDLEVTYPIIHPQNAMIFQVDGSLGKKGFGAFNTFLDAIDGSYCTYSAYGETGNDPNYDPTYPNDNYGGQLQCGVYRPPNVVSVSYGKQESELPAAYLKRQCNEWMKLGLQGVTVLYASGDDGVGEFCLGPDANIFSPSWPSSCPYITSVGGTVYPEDAPPEPGHEVAVQSFASGGGFSNLYDIPDYQKSAVQTYFQNYTPSYKYYSSHNNDSFGANGGIYNRNGRGYPDLAAIADLIPEIVNGGQIKGHGTSASAPIVGAIFTRINEERIAAGKSTIGFVNPVLYQHPEVFHDVVSGNNPGCVTADTPSEGFNASKGWDPVTGLGTPKYPQMLALFKGLK